MQQRQSATWWPTWPLDRPNDELTYRQDHPLQPWHVFEGDAGPGATGQHSLGKPNFARGQTVVRLHPWTVGALAPPPTSRALTAVTPRCALSSLSSRSDRALGTGHDGSIEIAEGAGSHGLRNEVQHVHLDHLEHAARCADQLCRFECTNGGAPVPLALRLPATRFAANASCSA